MLAVPQHARAVGRNLSDLFVENGNAVRAKLLALQVKHEKAYFSPREVVMDTLTNYFATFETTLQDGRVCSEKDLEKEQLRIFRLFKDDLINDAKAVTLSSHNRSYFDLSQVLLQFHCHRISASRNLNFYPEASRQLIAEVKKSDVVAVSTGTGSGKSTLMPLLLLAAGYKRIAVTQPRRFAAESIQDAICKLHGDTICGFRMAGRSKNPHAPIVYITDGLLRLMIGLQGCPLFDVIIIDEVIHVSC